MGLYARYIFPHLLEWGLGSGHHKKQRAIALAPARGRTLEIGFGTGLNLPHYPGAVTSLAAVDPARMMADRVRARITQARMPVEQINADASGRLPFDDDSFDSVVTTWTLCSIKELAPALREMRRVLKPEGRFIFLEHGLSDDRSVQKRQNLFNPLHRLIAGGCNINRPIDRLIESAALRVDSLDRFIMPKTPREFGEMYRGVARKL